MWLTPYLALEFVIGESATTATLSASAVAPKVEVPHCTLAAPNAATQCRAVATRLGPSRTPEQMRAPGDRSTATAKACVVSGVPPWMAA
jgi:hypothetical protein